MFSGQKLEHVDTLQLCNEPDLVTDAVARFLARTFEHFKPANAAIGISKAKQGERVKSLLDLTEKLLAADGIPIQKVEDKVLLESYAIPKLKNRNQLRAIVSSFWPHLGHKQLSAFEAAALGFHAQVERLLSHH